MRQKSNTMVLSNNWTAKSLYEAGNVDVAVATGPLGECDFLFPSGTADKVVQWKAGLEEAFGEPMTGRMYSFGDLDKRIVDVAFFMSGENPEHSERVSSKSSSP